MASHAQYVTTRLVLDARHTRHTVVLAAPPLGYTRAVTTLLWALGTRIRWCYLPCVVTVVYEVAPDAVLHAILCALTKIVVHEMGRAEMTVWCA